MLNMLIQKDVRRRGYIRLSCGRRSHLRTSYVNTDHKARQIEIPIIFSPKGNRHYSLNPGIAPV